MTSLFITKLYLSISNIFFVFLDEQITKLSKDNSNFVFISFILDSSHEEQNWFDFFMIKCDRVILLYK